jgi:hypothetical protein
MDFVAAATYWQWPNQAERLKFAQCNGLDARLLTSIDAGNGIE